MQHLIIPSCLAAALAPPSFPVPSNDEIQEIIIVVKTEEETPHRSPAQIPISGFVDTASGVVFLSFSTPCGTVNVTFSNLSNGDFLETSVNGTGSVMIPAVLSAGSWFVTFSLSDGSEYIGEFEIQVL